MRSAGTSVSCSPSCGEGRVAVGLPMGRCILYSTSARRITETRPWHPPCNKPWSEIVRRRTLRTAPSFIRQSAGGSARARVWVGRRRPQAEIRTRGGAQGWTKPATDRCTRPHARARKSQKTARAGCGRTPWLDLSYSHPRLAGRRAGPATRPCLRRRTTADGAGLSQIRACGGRPRRAFCPTPHPGGRGRGS